MHSLRELLIHDLRDLYSAETQILKALPKMEDKASHKELKNAFKEHTAVTEKQVQRLEQIFDDLGENPKGEHCKGMEGLLKEGEETMKKKADSDVLDAALIAAAQRVEHYEIAGYGTVRTYANMLRQNKHQDLLQQTLDEEGNTDKTLTRLAEQVVNPDAKR